MKTKKNIQNLVEMIIIIVLYRKFKYKITNKNTLYFILLNF